MIAPNHAPLEEAQSLFREGKLEPALEAGWQALRSEPDSVAAKSIVARLLQRVPAAVDGSKSDALLRLLRDPGIDPAQIANAGWNVVLTTDRLASIADASALAARLEQNALALALLEETYVARPDAERLLTDIRRWLLVHETWSQFPALAAALIAQARHNGGAWLFDGIEEERLQEAGSFRSAYLPEEHEAELRVERGENEVARQYEIWPYPRWSRITIPVPTTLRHAVNKLDPDGPDMPEPGELLVAGCGTGREAAIAAFRYPGARITAIDVSRTSLDYAATKCRDLQVEFHRLDLREVHRLGRRFDAIFCSGVLHHLPDPEAGWRALAEVLRPGGIMRVMLYSRLGRLKVAAAKKMIGDLTGQREDDRLLRAIRRRLLEAAPSLLADAFDFYTLPGVHDLLLNRHEDCFDIPRIGRALETLHLRLIGMQFPIAALEADYRKEHPEDPQLRDLDTIGDFERRHPFLFRSMYDIWCRKPSR